MCGILFHFFSNDQVLANFNKIKHRGPDNSSHLIIHEHFLGCHRLAIINQSPEGNQPLELNGIYLICNGQIYNYLQLANKYHIDPSLLRNDVDIIIHLYHLGQLTIHELVEELDGDFAFVLYDTHHDRIHIARDPFGVRPLFYATDENNQVIAVSSEVKAIEINNMLNINVFEPSTILTYDYITHTSHTQSYNVFSEQEEPPEPHTEKIAELLTNAVIKRIDNSDRPVAFLCSGGLDSSIILCIAHEYLMKQNREIHVFSMKYVNKKGNSQSEDDFYCSQLVRLLGVNYTSITYDSEEVKEAIEQVIQQTETYDPNTVRTSIANYILSKKIKETTDYKVFLSGEGADELFCGYIYFNQTDNSEQINEESRRLVKHIHMYDVLKADRCFNAFGLEIRIPFLDKTFVHYVQSINGKYKGFIGGEEKHLLREAFKQIYPVLTEARIIGRPKERFSDGVSFHYVPELLNYCSNHQYSELHQKEQAEREYYMNLFQKYYPNLEHLIAKRIIPEWCKKEKNIVKMEI
jgi:asparagine synthase (glutamine-hydrolysing)